MQTFERERANRKKRKSRLGKFFFVSKDGLKDFWNTHYTCFFKVDKLNGNLSVRNPAAPAGEPPKTFSFDHVFGDDTKQTDIYNLIARPICDAAIEGYNGNRPNI